jgi:hypothetical protein
MDPVGAAPASIKRECPRCGLVVMAGYASCPKCHAEIPGRRKRPTTLPSGTAAAPRPVAWTPIAIIVAAGIMLLILLLSR